VYLTDERNRRFLPVRDPLAIPFDVAVEPGQSASTSLTFHVPADAGDLCFADGMAACSVPASLGTEICRAIRASSSESSDRSVDGLVDRR
jgi:hypothetical protein